MSLFRVNFAELYVRHLCRHSQYGINVIHLASVVGSYLGLFALAFAAVDVPWVMLAVPIPYLAVLAFNVPVRVLISCLAFIALFMALFLALAPLPIWLGIGLIILSHYVQNWSHKIYTIERDMTEFNKKYKKGWKLFVLLSFYELPILLNYLVFDRKNWTTPEREPAVAQAAELADAPVFRS
jgi:hypothetical protein